MSSAEFIGLNADPELPVQKNYLNLPWHGLPGFALPPLCSSWSLTPPFFLSPTPVRTPQSRDCFS